MSHEAEFAENTILLLDPDEPARDMFAKILQSEGFLVLAAGTAQEGFDMANQYAGSIHLVIADLATPEASGELLAANLKRSRPATKFLLTVDGSNGWPLLQKPFPPSVLVAKIRQLLLPPPMAE
jgi:two-component system cell cycle sensor histidine kinase/response regulator CckA